MKPIKIIVPDKNTKFKLHNELINIHPFSDIKPTEDNYKWLALIHYLLYPYPEDNPFYYISEIEKESVIMKRLKIKNNNRPEWYNDVYNFTKDMYETPNMRLLRTCRITIDKMSNYLENINVDDKNFKNISTFLKEYESIRESYKKVLKDVEEEINYKSRGNTKIGYDIIT